MAAAGTLISDLGSGGPATDGDLVQQIFAEMNSTSDASPMTNLPPASSSRPITRMQQAGPNPNSTALHTMDRLPPQAHIIGGQQPTAADFAHMMGNGSPMIPNQSYYGHQNGYNPMMQSTTQGKGDIKQFIAKELKTPILVAIIAFIVSLPVMNTMIAHYIPSLIRIGGDVSTSGLLLKAAIAGGLFWLLQRVIVPLLIE